MCGPARLWGARRSPQSRDGQSKNSKTRVCTCRMRKKCRQEEKKNLFPETVHMRNCTSLCFVRGGVVRECVVRGLRSTPLYMYAGSLADFHRAQKRHVGGRWDVGVCGSGLIQ